MVEDHTDQDLQNIGHKDVKTISTYIPGILSLVELIDFCLAMSTLVVVANQWNYYAGGFIQLNTTY